MASTIELNKKRLTNVTSGSSAYDISYYDQAAPAYVPAKEPESAAVVQPEVKTRTAVRIVPTHGINVLTVVGFMLAAILIVMFLNSRVQLTELSDKSVALKNELTELKKEEAILAARSESAINLTEVEEIARTELGMVFPASGNVVYVELAGEDKAEILTEDSRNTTGSYRSGILER